MQGVEMPTVEFTWQDQKFQLVQEGVDAGSKFYIDGDEFAWMAVTEFPVPYADANHGLKTLGRLINDGKPGVWTFSRLWEIQNDIEYRREVKRVQAESLRQEEQEARATAELAELQRRFEVLREKDYCTLSAKAALDSCTESGGFNRPRRVVPTALPGARKKIEQLERDPLRVLLASLPGRSFHRDNLEVLKQVRILSHRSKGKIPVVTEDFLTGWYAEFVREPEVSKVDEGVLRFSLNDFVKPEELEVMELAPETVQIGEEVCRIEYIVEKDSDAVVTVVTMALATFRAHKDGLEELLPEGKLKLRLTGHKNGNVEGELGPDLDRRLRKLSQRRK